MSDKPVELDLKFLPDWLKESPTVNRYADYQGDTGDRPRRDGGDRRGPGAPGGAGGPRSDRGPRRDGPGGGGPRRDGPPRGGNDRGPRRDGPPRGGRAGGGRPFEQRREPDRAPRPPTVLSAPVKIAFLPEPHGLDGITRQIKSGARAYPLFGTARLFLEKPERHRVRVTSQDAAIPLFQCGDGPISFDRAAVERAAFRELRADYYKEEVVQGEPLKGNFSNVARCKSTGTLLGPTNYHGYQPGLRKLFEERFSRRMPFHEFQQYEIEVVTDEQVIADWKENARTTTTFVTLQEADPLVFKSAADAEAHFRKTYLPQVVKSSVTLETSGPASRAGGDRGIGAALRDAWEQEKQFPQNLVNLLRPAFQDAGLHYFKHRKRMIFISPIRPLRAPKGQVFSDDITSILATIEVTPKCTRRDLAVKILGESHELPEAAPRKAALAGDLHYLIQAGHVIEFHDGSLDLPLVPGDKGDHEKADKPAKPAPPVLAVSAEPAAAEPSDEVAPVADASRDESTSVIDEPVVEPIVEPVSDSDHPAELPPEARAPVPPPEVPETPPT